MDVSSLSNQSGETTRHRRNLLHLSRRESRRLSIKAGQLHCREQQKPSCKERGSNNWERQRKRVANVHQRIKDHRKDVIEKLTTRLARNFDVIVVENLSVKNMQQSGRLARHITQARWSQIVHRLRDKCEWYGRTLVIANKWFPSSQ